MLKWILIVLGLLIIAYFGWMAWTMRDVKTPTYTTTSKHGAIQIRTYAPMLIAEVTVKGPQQKALGTGFRKLAAFIFGDNTTQAKQSSQKIAMTAPVIQQSDKIAMTAPVIQQPNKIAMTAPVMSQASGDTNTWLVQFVMPAHYTIQTLPKPTNKHIHIFEQPSQQMIALRFSGRATPDVIAKQQAKLEAYISKHKLKTVGAPSYAFYNPPWTLPFLRRNEILWRLAS
jgi:hypothetical protein